MNNRLDGYLEMSDSEHKETVSATGWNVVSPEEARGSESESSCEFVNITDDCTASYSKEKPADDPLEQKRPADQGQEEGSVEAVGGEATLFSSGTTDSTSSDRDRELQRLMDILQQRVQNSSPGQSSSDSDFVHISPSYEADEMVGSSSSVGSRFNILLRDEYEDQDGTDTNKLKPANAMSNDARNGYHRQDEENRDADADDRVESDILSANHIADLVPPQEWYDDGAAVRNYTQSPNRDLNALLSVLAVAAIGFAVGIATGHYIGSAREAFLQSQVQEGQRLRLQSVQDDLLMCLRKQEDIDQTINKLNEIEDILVDAEHWRNEYEELLNAKLENDEKWRKEKTVLEVNLNQAEKTRGLPCSHDEEYLSRQESTLNSVHEKLEENLKLKDVQIDQLQKGTTECQIALSTSTKMSAAYKKSNEEKSLLILQLKEQLLASEREVFDLQINADSDSPANSMLEERTQSLQFLVANLTEQNLSLQSKFAKLQSIPSSDDLSAQLSDTVQQLATCQQQVTNMGTWPIVSGFGMTDVNQTFTQTDGTLIADLTDLNQELLQQVELLREKLFHCQAKNKSNCMDTTNGTSCTTPTVINLCDKLNVNLTTEQVLRIYNATKMNHHELGDLIGQEWSRIRQEVLHKFGNITSNSTKDEASWHNYVNKTHGTVSGLIEKAQIALNDINEITRVVSNSTLAKKTKSIYKRISKNLAKLTKDLQDGFGSVQQSVQTMFTRQMPSNDAQREVSRHTAKRRRFSQALDELVQSLSNMVSSQYSHMKRHQRKKMYDRFDDFFDEYSSIFADESLSNAKHWIECQLKWWKDRIKWADNDILPAGCLKDLLSWQIGNMDTQDEPFDHLDSIIDGSWFYERAEHREFHRDEPDDWFWRRSHD